MKMCVPFGVLGKKTGAQQMQACKSVFLPPRFLWLCDLLCTSAGPGSLGVLMDRGQDIVV